MSLMKRCPKCSRTFPDDNQKFCTIDGGLLVAGDKPFDPNATIQSSAAPPAEPPVSSHPPDWDETIAASAPTVEPTRASSAPVRQPPSKPTPPPPAKSAPLPAAQRAPAPAATGVQPVAKKKSKLPLILGILAILLVLGAGAVVAAFFIVIKP